MTPVIEVLPATAGDGASHGVAAPLRRDLAGRVARYPSRRPKRIEGHDDFHIFDAGNLADRPPDPFGEGLMKGTSLGGQRHGDQDAATIDLHPVDQAQVHGRTGQAPGRGRREEPA